MLKIFNLLKFGIIIGLIGIIVSIVLFLINPLNFGEVELVSGKIDNLTDNYTEYSFETLEGNHINAKVNYRNDSCVEQSDVVTIRYLKNNPNINAINLYEYVFKNEYFVLSMSLFIFFFCLGGFFVSKYFERNQNKIMEELNTIKLLSILKNTLYYVLILIGIALVLFGFFTILVNSSMQSTAFGIVFMLIGITLDINFIYELKKMR